MSWLLKKHVTLFSILKLNPIQMIAVKEVREWWMMAESFAKTKRQRCVYCNSESHFPSQWEKVSNVKSRTEILRKNFSCLSFLKSRYFFKNWISSYICEKKDQEKAESSEKSADNVVAHLGVRKGTLLQTPKGKVAGINKGAIWITTQILFDTGSQRTYLTENLRKHLKLKTIQTENLIAKHPSQTSL